MKGTNSDTIAALATPLGPGLRALVRISGPASRAIGETLVRATLLERIPVAVTELEDVSLPATVVLFCAPRSYTREDLLEISLPSSPPLVQRFLRRLAELGARPAEPGEFTRRAFLSGRIDLSRAEGILELVRSRNEREFRAGILLLEGGLAARVRGLRDGIEGALALLEASLDFEESDTGHVDRPELSAALRAASQGLDEATRWESRRASPRGELRVFLWGAPNAGKSSLLNRLDPSAQAIVSPIAGTTRDCLRGSVRDGDTEISILDAAGEDRGGDFLSERAQEIARRFRESADRVIGVVDGSKPLPRFLLEGRVDLLVLNKADLPRGCDLSSWNSRAPILETSALSGQGIEELRAGILSMIGKSDSGEGEAANLAERHREALQRAAREVASAQALLSSEGPLDATAGCLREALSALGEIDGETTPEHILDKIFSQFCIGK